MQLTPLPWDSDFFSRRIARLDVTNEDLLADILQLLHDEKENYELIYVFSQYKFPQPTANNNYVDFIEERITYTCTTSNGGGTLSDNIKTYNQKPLTATLEQLAWTCAEYSRFKADRRFGDDYKRLYTRWMENSLNQTLADSVFIYDAESLEKGFVTITLHNGHANIELIAVDASSQGKGIGSKLLSHVKAWLYQHEIPNLTVTTQQGNIKACHLYERHGMKVSNRQYVYHFWTTQPDTL